MGFEIERKFLVTDNSFLDMATSSEAIEQGYLSRDVDRTVRVRVKGDRAYLTVKSRNEGCVRHEWEYGIPVADARQMLELCTGVIVKRRHYVPYGGHTFEVDVFGGRHAGLVVAEVEMQTADEAVKLPPFVGREVTGNARYYNSSLASDSSPNF